MEAKMKKPCRLLNRYRDGELEPPLRALFESHMAACAECRRTIALLNNLVRVLKPAGPEAPPAFSERVARLAFERANTWDVMVTTWVRPTPAWIALAFSALLTTYMWLSPMLSPPVEPPGDYEIISSDTDITAGTYIQTVDFSTWLEVEEAR